MSNPVVSNIRRDCLLNLLAEGRREDGRQFDEFRDIKVETGLIESADGSARVELGDTVVMAGVKIVPGVPYADAPGDGTLTTGMELLPMAHPMFEPGPPDENAIEIARVVDRGIRESGMIDVKKLCIKERESIWMVFLDLYAINHDGNLIDAATVASVCGLKSAKIPWKQYFPQGVNGAVKEDEPLPVTCIPVSVTEHKIGNDLIVDPNFDEETVAAARLTVTTDENGNYRAMQKGGRGPITRDDLSLCLDRAVEIGDKIRSVIR